MSSRKPKLAAEPEAFCSPAGFGRLRFRAELFWVLLGRALPAAPSPGHLRGPPGAPGAGQRRLPVPLSGANTPGSFPPGSPEAFLSTPPPAGPPGQGLSPQRGAPRLVRASPAPRLPAPFPRRSSARRLPPRLLPHREGGSAELPGTAQHSPA